MRWHCWMVFAASVMVSVGVVRGQVQVDTSHGLDANPGVNTRYNSPVNRLDFSRRNALITGNVGGLGFFRGPVGYFAPGEFEGPLGSSDLFRFRAESLPPSFQGRAGASPGSGGGLNPTIYRLYTPSARDIRGGYRPGAGLGRRPLSSSPLDSNMGVIDSHVYTGRRVLPSSSSDSSSLFGYLAAPGGRVLEMRASPLFGVTSRDTRVIGLLESMRRTQQPAALPAPTPRDEQSEPSDEQDRNPLHSIQPGQGMNPAEREAPQGWSPGLELGALLQPRLGGQRLEGKFQSIDEQMAQIQARLFSPLGRFETKPGEDVYLDLLKRIQRGGQGQASENKKKPSSSEQEKPALLEPPTPQQMVEAESARQEAEQRVIGKVGETKGEGEAKGEGEGTPGAGGIASPPDWRVGPL